MMDSAAAVNTIYADFVAAADRWRRRDAISSLIRNDLRQAVEVKNSLKASDSWPLWTP
jgi:hypothetical protein